MFCLKRKVYLLNYILCGDSGCYDYKIYVESGYFIYKIKVWIIMRLRFCWEVMIILFVIVMIMFVLGFKDNFR